jgi:UDP-N-acetylmuramoyl-tripeptide--D-alanyl-D-alanine ligase
MRAALLALERMGEGRRTWAVLGTMLELGEESEPLHAEVGEEAVARGVDELLVVGRPAAALADGARGALSGTGASTRVRTVEDADAAEALLRAELEPGDVVLFKSSRDAGLRLLGDRLAAPSEEQT